MSNEETRPTSSSDRYRAWLKAVEDVGKAGLVIAGGLYTIGFLVRGLFLLRFGFFNSQFIRAEYVLTGVCVALPAGLVLLALSVIGFVYLTARAWIKNRGTKLRRLVTGSFFFVALLFVSLLAKRSLFVAHSLGAFTSGEATLVSRSIFAVGESLFWLALFTAAYLLTRKFAPLRQLASVETIALGTGVSVGLLLLALAQYISAFSDFVYPRIPQGFGGGKPVTVQFLLRADRRPEFITVLRQNVSKPYQLLGQTDDSYLVVLDSDVHGTKAMQFERSAVAGYVVSAPRYTPILIKHSHEADPGSPTDETDPPSEGGAAVPSAVSDAPKF